MAHVLFRFPGVSGRKGNLSLPVRASADRSRRGEEGLIRRWIKPERGPKRVAEVRLADVEGPHQRINVQLSVIISCGIEPNAFVQDSPTRYMVHLDPHAGGVLEQY